MLTVSRALGVFYLAVFILWTLAGCADIGGSTPQVSSFNPLVSEELRSRLGRVGLVAIKDLPKVEVDTPARGSMAGAGRKAVVWSRDWVLGALELGAGGQALGALVTAAVLALTPVVTITGAVYGAVAAEDAVAVDQGETRIRESLIELNYGQVLRTHVVGEASRHADVVTLVPIDQLSQGGSDTQSHASLAKEEIDTIIELRLESISLRGQWDVDAPLAVTVKSQARMLEPLDGTLLHESGFSYTTKTRRLSEWSADNAKAFREAMELSFQRLAEFMVEGLFITHPFAHDHQ